MTEQSAAPGQSASRTSSVGRRRLALLLGCISLVAAALAAAVSSVPETAVYSWPAVVPSGKAPARGWVGPLLLNRGTPRSLSVSFPCVAPSSPRGRAGKPVLLLSTAPSGGVLLRLHGQSLDIHVGDDYPGDFQLGDPASAAPGCTYDFHTEGRHWSLTGGPSTIAKGGPLAHGPRVSALRSDVDLRMPGALKVRVDAIPQDSRPSALQSVARLLSFVALIGALGLLLVPFPRLHPRAAFRRLRVVDGVVVAALAGWLLVAPAFYDDGWVVTRQSNARLSGGFSNYFDTFAVNLPLGTWLEWLEHWVTSATSTAIVQRIPVLVVVFAAWLCARWCFEALRAPALSAGTGEWTLACAYLVGTFAWGMTLRPEPVVMLLVVGSLVCSIAIARGALLKPLTVAGILVAFSVTAHPAGVVAAAPLVAILPTIIRRIRELGPGKLFGVGAAVVCSGATAILLAFVDSSITERRDQSRVFSETTAHGSGWRDELLRYTSLSGEGASMVRRASVGLLLMAVLGYATRRGRTRSIQDIAAASVAIGLVMLFATPSKWFWHFGVLAALGAVAVAIEVNRLVEEARAGERGASARAVLAAGVAGCALILAWSPRRSWGTLDLISVSWPTALGADHIPYAQLTLVAVGGLLLAVLIYAVGRTGRDALARVPVRLPPFIVPALFAPLLVFTVAVLLVDAAQTDGWTFTRQNLDAVTGRGGCGLGDYTRMVDPRSVRPLTQFAEIPRPVARADRARIPRYDHGPIAVSAGPGNATQTGWFRVPTSTSAVGIPVFGQIRGDDRLTIEWGHTEHGAVSTLVNESAVVPTSQLSWADSLWSIIPASSLPPRPPGADAVRVSLTPNVGAPPRTLAVGAPVSYRVTTMSDTLRSNQGRVLVPPDIVLYVPCAVQPRVSLGAAVLPTLTIVSPLGLNFPLFDPSSPFFGAKDSTILRQLIPENAIERGVSVLELLDRPDLGRLRVATTEGH